MAPCPKCSGAMWWDAYHEERYCAICGFRLGPKCQPVAAPKKVEITDAERIAFRKGERALGRYLKGQAAG